MKIRTRMAPSPTGDMHVGSLATALKNYAFAKKHNGQFILRIEDTDKTREVEGGVKAIQNIIHAYGLNWDEGPGKGGKYGPYIQSEKQELGIYEEKAEELVRNGHAYRCICSKERLKQIREQARAKKQPPKYDGHCYNNQEEVEKKIKKGAEYVIRMRIPFDEKHPPEPIKIHDLIRGDIFINTDNIDDQVLLKSDGYPTYHLAVVVDDHDMRISHIMRGEEWLPSTPKHVWLYQKFGWDEAGEMPEYAHIPVYLNPDGKGKMSKRKGDVSAQSFLNKGYLPEAMLNFFMILGWAPKDQREIITLPEYIQEFDPKDMSKKSVVFDMTKLGWMNGMYIRKLYEQGNLSDFWDTKDHHIGKQSLQQRAQPFLPNDFPNDQFNAILELIYERLERLDEIEELTSFFYRDIKIDTKLLLKKADANLVSQQLQMTRDALLQSDDWSLSFIESTVRKLQEKNEWKRGQYFMMLRVATTGRKVSPPLFETMHVMGKEKTLKRLEQAKALINA